MNFLKLSLGNQPKRGAGFRDAASHIRFLWVLGVTWKTGPSFQNLSAGLCPTINTGFQKQDPFTVASYCFIQGPGVLQAPELSPSWDAFPSVTLGKLLGHWEASVFSPVNGDDEAYLQGQCVYKVPGNRIRWEIVTVTVLSLKGAMSFWCDLL